VCRRQLVRLEFGRRPIGASHRYWAGFLDNPSAHLGKPLLLPSIPRRTKSLAAAAKTAIPSCRCGNSRPAKDRRGNQFSRGVEGSRLDSDGDLLLERADDAWTEPSSFKLIVLDGKLKERNAFDLPKGLITYSR